MQRANSSLHLQIIGDSQGVVKGRVWVHPKAAGRIWVSKPSARGSLQPCKRKTRGTKDLEAKAADLAMGVGDGMC